MNDPGKFKAPFNPKERIWQEADKLRAAYRAGRELPVKILDLAEFDLGLELIPVDGLREQLDIDALLMGNLKSILVDTFSVSKSVPSVVPKIGVVTNYRIFHSHVKWPHDKSQKSEKWSGIWGAHPPPDAVRRAPASNISGLRDEASRITREARVLPDGGQGICALVALLATFHVVVQSVPAYSDLLKTPSSPGVWAG